MDMLSGEGFRSKAKCILSAIGGVILWPSWLQSSMQIPNQYSLHQRPQPAGLKTLVVSSSEEPITQNLCNPSFDIITSYMLSSPSPPSSSSPSLNTPSLLGSLTHYSSWPPVMDDLIGTESGVYMKSHEAETVQADKAKVPDHSYNLGRRSQQRCAMTREYPPPIPLLARTGNLPGHMPWVLTRHYNNGKLVLKEERVKHHQYFEAYRENGRLILNLVLLDDSITSRHEKDNEDQELEGSESIKEEQEIDGFTSTGEEKQKEYEADDYYLDNTTVVEETTHNTGSITILDSEITKTYLENGVERYGTLRRCFTYTGREISHINFFCNANTYHEPGGMYVAHSDSVPLALPIRPMTTVM